MPPSMFSPLWCRYAQLRPQLHAQVSVRRTPNREKPAYLLTDGATGGEYRIDGHAYQFVGRCNGRNTMDDIWDVLLQTLGAHSPSQPMVIRLLSELDQHRLLHHAVPADKA